MRDSYIYSASLVWLCKYWTEAHKKKGNTALWFPDWLPWTWCLEAVSVQVWPCVFTSSQSKRQWICDSYIDPRECFQYVITLLTTSRAISFGGGGVLMWPLPTETGNLRSGQTRAGWSWAAANKHPPRLSVNETLGQVDLRKRLFHPQVEFNPTLI